MIDSRSKKILEYIKVNDNISSSQIHQGVNLGVELITIKRLLSNLVAKNLLNIYGRGRATKYVLSKSYK